MKKQAITISTVPVTIRVIEVGGKKMTQSVFNQIPNKNFGMLTESEQSESYIGWVKHNGFKFILLHFEGVLARHGVLPALEQSQQKWLDNKNQIYIAI